MLDVENKQIIEYMIDFVEENWNSFVQRCEERGMTEKEIEKEITDLKEREAQ